MSEEKRPPHLVSMKETWAYILARPEMLEETIVLGVAMGSTLRRIASNWAVPYPWVFKHVMGDPDLKHKYELALGERKEYMLQFLFDQFKTLAESDLRQLFNKDGSMKAIHEWPENAAQWVSAVEVDELFEGAGKERQQIGFTKKVKLWDKMKALESLAKHMNFVVDSKENSGKLTWEALIMMSMKAVAEREKPVQPKTVVEAAQGEIK